MLNKSLEACKYQTISFLSSLKMKERKSQLNKSRILWLIDYLNSSTCKIEVSTDYFCLFMFLAMVSVKMVFNVSFSTKEKEIVYLLKKN